MEEDKSVRAGSDNLSKFIWIGAIIVILSALVLLLWKVGLFNENNAQSSGQIIAGVLALFGAIITASVALTGYFLKRSFDEHSLRLQQTTEERLKQEGEQNRRRLDMETAIEAVKLMSASDGKEASESQKSGALFALVTLDQIDLALALISTLWKQGAVDKEAAVWVIDRAFQSGVRRHQVEAGTLLYVFRGNLYDEDSGLQWPECFLLDWTTKVDSVVRILVLRTLLEILPGKPLSFWKIDCIFGIITILQNAVIKDPNLIVKAGAILMQNILLQHFSSSIDDKATISTCEGPVTLETMKGNRAAFAAENGAEATEFAGRDFLEASERIVEWLSQESKATN